MHRALTLRTAAAAVALATFMTPCAATVCIATASPLAFGIFESLLPGDDDTTGVVTVICTPGIGSPLQSNYTITIAGTGTAGDTVRSATMCTQRLYYQLYKDAGRTTVWGNGTTSGSGVSSSVTSASVVLPASQNHTVYARLPGNQQVKPGIYLGSVVVTVDY